MSLMNRIVFHHTGGTYKPNVVDKKAYHVLIDGDGKEHAGRFPILNNAPGRIRRGSYAAHTRGLNTGTIGVSLCSMGGGQWADPFGGRYPVKIAQVDALVAFLARASHEYGIDVDRRFILSHAEVEQTLGVKQRNKWDFDYDPRGGSGRDPIAIGDEIRQEVLFRLEGVKPNIPQVRPVLRQGSRGDTVIDLQAALVIPEDGMFGPQTRSTVVRFQRNHGLLPDGIVGSMTWAALFPT